MDLFERALGEIRGDWVIDVVAGWGGVVDSPADKLAGFTQIVGIDLSARMLAESSKNVDLERGHFIQMDAG